MAPFPFECQSTIPGELWEFQERGAPLCSRTQQIILTLPSITRNKFQLPRETHFSSSPLHPSLQCRSLFPENCDGQGSTRSRRPTKWKGEKGKGTPTPSSPVKNSVLLYFATVLLLPSPLQVMVVEMKKPRDQSSSPPLERQLTIFRFWIRSSNVIRTAISYPRGKRDTLWDFVGHSRRSTKRRRRRNAQWAAYGDSYLWYLID